MLCSLIPHLPTSCSPRARGALTSWGGLSCDHLVGMAGFRKEQDGLGRSGEEASSFACFYTQLEDLLLWEAFLVVRTLFITLTFP